MLKLAASLPSNAIASDVTTRFKSTGVTWRHQHKFAAPGSQRASMEQTQPPSKSSDANASKAETLAQMYKGFAAQFPQVKGIDAKAVHALLASPSAAEVVLVDVRTPGEQEVSRLPGKAASAGEGCLTGPGPFVITKEDFDRVKADYKDRQIITYCTAGFRSGKYADQLQKEGFSVRNLEGSILSWTHERYPLVTGPTGEPTKRVHVFGQKWLIQGEDYEAVWYHDGQGAVAVVKSSLPKWLGGQ